MAVVNCPLMVSEHCPFPEAYRGLMKRSMMSFLYCLSVGKEVGKEVEKTIWEMV